MRRVLAAAVLLMLWHAPAASEEVVIEEAGLDLIGNLELANGKTLKADGAALITHGTLGHHGMEIIATWQKGLRQRGVNSLAITLSLGLDNRRGFYDCALEHDHRHSDGVTEIGAWVAWLKTQGAPHVALVGHSRGANQTALYASGAPDAIVERVALIAPPAATREEMAAQYRAAFKSELAPLLEQARQLVERDEGETALEGVGFLSCPAARVTAGAFLDYYDNDAARDTPALLAKLPRPVLVLVGDADTVVPGLAAAMRARPVPANVTFEIIPGADHFFRDLAADDLADRLAPFLKGGQPAAK